MMQTISFSAREEEVQVWEWIVESGWCKAFTPKRDRMAHFKFKFKFVAASGFKQRKLSQTIKTKNKITFHQERE